MFRSMFQASRMRVPGAPSLHSKGGRPSTCRSRIPHKSRVPHPCAARVGDRALAAAVFRTNPGCPILAQQGWETEHLTGHEPAAPGLASETWESTNVNEGTALNRDPTNHPKIISKSVQNSCRLFRRFLHTQTREQQSSISFRSPPVCFSSKSFVKKYLRLSLMMGNICSDTSLVKAIIYLAKWREKCTLKMP